MRTYNVKTFSTDKATNGNFDMVKHLGLTIDEVMEVYAQWFEQVTNRPIYDTHTEYTQAKIESKSRKWYDTTDRRNYPVYHTFWVRVVK